MGCLLTGNEVDTKGGKWRESGIFACGQVCRTFGQSKCNVLIFNDSTLLRQSTVVEILVQSRHKEYMRYKCDPSK